MPVSFTKTILLLILHDIIVPGWTLQQSWVGGADGEHNEARNFKHKTRKRDKKKKTTIKEVSVLGKLQKKKKKRKENERQTRNRFGTLFKKENNVAGNNGGVPPTST